MGPDAIIRDVQERTDASINVNGDARCKGKSSFGSSFNISGPASGNYWPGFAFADFQGESCG